MYRYETHLHTLPCSKCAKYSVGENLAFYKQLGYDGVFITNHFLDGNTAVDKTLPYAERLRLYFDDYREACSIGEALGIKIFLGVEMSYAGTDFLVYGLDEAWYAAHPEIASMKKSEELPYLMEQGALVVQAHPFREASYIDHIRLFPKGVQGIEVINACRKDHENRMAELYAEVYGFVPLAGSDNHVAHRVKRLAGIETETPIADEADFIRRVLAREVTLFVNDNPLLPPPEEE